VKRTPLVRKTPMRRTAMKRSVKATKPWRRPVDDQVRPEVWEAVMRRDQGCMAPQLDATAGACYSQWDEIIDGAALRATIRATDDLSALLDGVLTAQHVHWNEGDPAEYPASVKGKRAPSKDASHLLAMCWGHHLGNGWATNADNLVLQRRHLMKIAKEA
jgi:hypothetical protein